MSLFPEDRHHCLEENAAPGSKWQSDEQSHTQKLNSLDLFVLGGDRLENDMNEFVTVIKAADNKAALNGRISACPLLSEFLPLSLAFFRLIRFWPCLS